MTVIQPHTTYDNVASQKRMITDAIDIIDPVDTPLTVALGGLDGAQGKFRFVSGTLNTKPEWLEDDAYAHFDALNGSIADGVTTTITVNVGAKFVPGHIIEIEDEGMHVTSVAVNVLTVSRGFYGSAVAHADLLEVEIVSMARLEGAASDKVAETTRRNPFNYTQIFHDEVEVTGSQQAMMQYGMSGEFEYQAMKQVPEQMVLVEKANFRGARNAGPTPTRSTGPFSTFITQNLVPAAGAVTEAHLIQAQRLAFEAGGGQNWIAPIHPANADVIDQMHEAAQRVRVEQQASELGFEITTVRTRYGVTSLVLDRWADPSRIEMIDPTRAGWVTYRAWQTVPLSKDGDTDRQQLVGEYALCVRQDAAHAAITGITP